MSCRASSRRAPSRKAHWRRPWGAARTLLWMGGAFAVGGIPSGRIVAKAVAGESLEDLGDGKPGSSNVARSLGWKPGALTLALDAGKAYVPAAAARLAGAGEGTVAAVGIATMLGHITLVKGRGAACGLGAAYAMDPKMMTLDLVPIICGSVLHHHAEGVSLTAVALPLTSLALHRDEPSRALGPLALIAVIFGARLRGTPGAGFPHTLKAWWYRFWLDRDTKG
ncbi:MAG TPA: glycerol-3-phosphate acyltransferase [Thermoleophilia bacterium]|nr:glycerol-3-phosphate acyltransferase [Thermoleophilia bacterium]